MPSEEITGFFNGLNLIGETKMSSKSYWTAYFIAVGVMLVVLLIMLYGIW